jgi:type III restriction enzyme
MFKQLFNFQEEAAQEIAQRFLNYHFSERIRYCKENATYDGIPFFQFLDAITGAGKTVILVRTISLMSQQLETKPIILWLSKLSVVVKQSMAKLEAGGEYFGLFGNKLLTFSLDQYKESNLEEDEHVLLFLATVGTFNQKDKEEGDRKIFACNIDNQNKST